jgi:hypothetical protein
MMMHERFKVAPDAGSPGLITLNNQRRNVGSPCRPFDPRHRSAE